MHKHPLFNNINHNIIPKHLNIISYPKDTLLFSEGEECKFLGVILSGEVKISTLTSKDNEYTISILKDNDIFGENLLFNQNNLFLGDGIVTKDAKIIFIEKDILLELLKNTTFMCNFLNIITQKNMEVRGRLKLLSQKTIEERIMFYLISEVKKEGTKKIKIKSKEDLAHTLNIPRPSLSRELIKLKEKGVIDYDKHFIELKDLN